MLRHVLFAERMPNKQRDGSYVLAAYPGGAWFVLHWPTDAVHVEHPECLWLEGARIPPVPQPHEVCCCQRKKAA